ncbi:VOC family protein [Methanolobus sediminis]|uniref:VOC family protein n=1 Tax=Methanolobus sediminis TaxID=3072978 RepID=A0AA51UKD8_9EURY|nr:VOC family protein [Methanolobus sediminis]WMW24994.1 VOC family protein [Methanolobus sediminis]
MPTFIHIDIPTDNVERAKKFYSDIFEWTFEKPSPEMDYYLFSTKDLDGKEGIRGGMGLRGEPDQKIAAYIGVDSIEKYASQIQKTGGKVLNKMPVPGWGTLAICLDTEGNLFGLWEDATEENK